MIRKTSLVIFVLVLTLSVVLSGCRALSETSGGSGLNPSGPLATSETPASGVGCLMPTTPPPYLGLWNLDDAESSEMVVFTETSYYLVETGTSVSPDGGTRERFAEITAIDVENQQVTLMTKWIRVNGKMMGYDSPQFFLTYRVEDGKLSFSTSTEGFPAEATTGPFVQK